MTEMNLETPMNLFHWRCRFLNAFSMREMIKINYRDDTNGCRGIQKFISSKMRYPEYVQHAGNDKINYRDDRNKSKDLYELISLKILHPECIQDAGNDQSK